jgi:hypothetical protein
MQRALYRHFWTANTFYVSKPQHSGGLHFHERPTTFYDDLLHTKHFVVVVEDSYDRFEMDINLDGASTIAIVRLTSLSVTPHLQVPVRQDIHHLILPTVRAWFYDDHSRRRVLCGQNEWEDRLYMMLESCTNISYTATGRFVGHRRNHDRRWERAQVFRA